MLAVPFVFDSVFSSYIIFIAANAVKNVNYRQRHGIFSECFYGPFPDAVRFSKRSGDPSEHCVMTFCIGLFLFFFSDVLTFRFFGRFRGNFSSGTLLKARD